MTTAAEPVRSRPQGRELLLGVQPAVGGVDGQRAGDGRDRLLAVAAQDGGAYPELVQPGDGANRLLAQGGGDGKDADGLIVDHDGDRRLPPAAEFLRPCLQLGRQQVLVRPHHADGPAAQPAGHADAGEDGHVDGAAPWPVGRTDGSCNGMLDVGFDGGREVQDLLGGTSIRRRHSHHGGDPHGEGARLVEGAARTARRPHQRGVRAGRAARRRRHLPRLVAHRLEPRHGGAERDRRPAGGLSVRHGPGHAGGHDGGLRPGLRPRHPHPQRRRPRAAGRASTRWPSTRRAPSPWASPPSSR